MESTADDFRLGGAWYLDPSHGQPLLLCHLSGAAIGFLIGLTVFRKKRHWAQELVEDK